MQAPQVTSPPPGQKTLSGFLQGGSARDSRSSRSVAEPPAADCTEVTGTSADQPEPVCKGQGSGLGPGPDGREDASGAARAASAYFAVATHAPGGRARLPGGYGDAARGAGPLGAQSSGSDGHAGAGAAAGAGGNFGPVASPVEDLGEGYESQGVMPSLREWAASAGAPGDASGGLAAQEGDSLAVGRGAGDTEESSWPEGYFPAEAETDSGDAGDAEDEEEGEEAEGGAAGFAEPGDPSLAPGQGSMGSRTEGEEEDEAAGERGHASVHAAGRAGQAGYAREPGGAVRDRGALARWQCLVCTFAGNRAGVLRCALCDTLKGSRAWQPPRAVQAGTLPDALPGSLAATLDLLGRASSRAPGSGDALQSADAAAQGPAGSVRPSGACAGASDVPASDAAGGAAPAPVEAEGAESQPGSEADVAPPHAGTATQGADSAASSPAAKPDWEPVEGPSGGGWRCRRCGEVIGGGVAWGGESGSEAGSVGAQARGAHDDWHFALEMQRLESGPGHEPGPRGIGSGASGAGDRSGGGPGRGVGVGGRGAQGRKRKASGKLRPVRERSRLSRGTMDAFLLRANAKGS